MGRLVPRLRALGTEVVAVESIADAIRQLDDRDRAVQLVFFPMPPAPQLGEILGSIRKASLCSGARFVAVGPRPSAEEREVMELAGVEACLHEPIADTQLRFAINQAGYEPGDGRCRKSVRVPAAMAARIITGMGERDALVYSLSAGGAYVETPRVTIAGGQVKLELPLPSGTIAVDARVLYHNVVGNLQQENLAVGMGLEFIEMDAETRETIADYVDECMESQTGRKPPQRTAEPLEEEAPPEEPSRYPWLEAVKPWLEVLKGIERRYLGERAEPEQIPAVEESPPTEASPKPEHNPTDSGNRVVVRCRDGRLIKGYTLDFLPNKDVFHVVAADDENEITELRSSEPRSASWTAS
jgi:hypothetical protein